MALRIALPLALAGCLALAGTSLARDASVTATPVKPTPGKFKGRTSQHTAMSFTVSRRHRVTAKSFDVRFRCTDGYRSSFTITKPIPIPIVGGAFNRSWSGTSHLGYFYTVTLAGSFPSARRATGTISLGINRRDHGGGCSSGRISWTARNTPRAVG